MNLQFALGLGDCVLLLVPNAACKFLACWQGLHTVHKDVGPVNYQIQQPGKRAEAQLYHITLLKHRIKPAAALHASALSVSGPIAPVHKYLELMPTQKQDLVVLEHHFWDVFSPRAGVDKYYTALYAHPAQSHNLPMAKPGAQCMAINTEVKCILEMRVIEESTSPGSSPIMVVPKSEGWHPMLRLCNDFGKLNEVANLDSDPILWVDKLIERPGRTHFISTLDLSKGYWHVPLALSACTKTAFSTATGNWQYRVLSFGLPEVPAMFQ